MKPYKAMTVENVQKMAKMNTDPIHPVTIIEPGHSKIPKSLRDEITVLPDYEKASDFKDMIVTKEYCNLFELGALKAYYRETHPRIQW